MRSHAAMLRLVLWLTAGAMGLGIGGCTLVGSADDPPLVGMVWRLEAFVARGAMASLDDAFCTHPAIRCVDPDRTYTVAFRADGRLDAQADCNACGGSYMHDAGGTFRIDQLVCTEVACRSGSQGTAFARALGEAHRYRIREDVLLVAYGDGKRLILRAVADRRGS